MGAWTLSPPTHPFRLRQEGSPHFRALGVLRAIVPHFVGSSDAVAPLEKTVPSGPRHSAYKPLRAGTQVERHPLLRHPTLPHPLKSMHPCSWEVFHWDQKSVLRLQQQLNYGTSEESHLQSPQF